MLRRCFSGWAGVDVDAPGAFCGGAASRVQARKSTANALFIGVIRDSLTGERDFSFAPCGAWLAWHESTHGLRRGLHSFAASRLKFLRCRESDLRVLAILFGRQARSSKGSG